MLNVNDSFKLKTINNNSNCTSYHGGPHGVTRQVDSGNMHEIFKVKQIHYGGIYDIPGTHTGTIETYCNCFIRYIPEQITKID